MHSVVQFRLTLLRSLLIVVALLGLLAIAAAPAADAAATSGTDDAIALSSARTLPDAAVIILIALTVVLLGGAISRVLWRLRVIRDFVWVLLVFCVCSGLTWLVVGTLCEYTPETNPYRFAKFLSLFFLFVLALSAIARFVLPPEARRTRAAVPPLIRNIAIIVLAVLVLFILLLSIFPGLSLTPVFYTSGVVSIVIGLAVQDVLSNLLAGLLLSVDRPYDVGDWVHIGETEGAVVEINWRTTKLRDRQGDYVDIPNSTIAKERIVNHNRPSSLHLRRVLVGVTYDTPPGLTTMALLDAARRTPGVLSSPPPEVHFKDYQDFSLLYELRAWIDSFESWPVIDSDIRREIWYSFKRHGITIPFPIRDVNLRKVVEQPQRLHARLVASVGLPKGTIIELTEDTVTLGRDPQSTICLSDQHVSNHHAVIERRDGSFVLRDLGSRHGTRVNGQPVQTCLLHRGDEVGIGPFILVFETNLAPIPEGDKTPPWASPRHTTPPGKHGRAAENGTHDQPDTNA